jgi:restriction system protein
MQKKSKSRLAQLFPGVLVALVILPAVPRLLYPLLALAVVVVVLAVVVAVLRANVRTSSGENLMRTVEPLIDEKLDQLTRRRAQLLRRDAYGRVVLDAWIKEVDYFIDSHIRTRLAHHDQQLLQAQREQVALLITRRTYERMQAEPVFRTFSDGMTPTEFESFCAEQLRLSGWDAQVTIRSRDQGVDVVAEKAGMRVVLQCKLYSGPVGNGAVQEIAVGRAHERAQYGAVVTNSRYTAPAEQLAATNGIEGVKLSTTLSTRTLRPFASASCTKSNDHSSLGSLSTG